MPFASYLTVEWAPASTPQAGSPTWVDISSKVMSLETSAGSSGLLDTFGAGTLRLEAWNVKPGVAGWADPNTWYKGRQIRVKTATATLFHGWVRSLVHNVNKPHHTTVTVNAIDVVGTLAEAATTGDFETFWGTSPETDAVYGRIIDGVRGYADDTAVMSILGWLQSTANIVYVAPAVDNGAMPMFVDAKQTGGLNTLQEFLETEGSYLSRDTTTPTSVAVQGRYLPFTLNAAAATATLTDTGGNYRYLRDTLELAAPDETYFDQATVGGAGVDPKHTADVPDGWFATTWTRTRTPIVDDAYAQAVADHIVAVGKRTDTYPRRVTCLVAGPVAGSVDASHPGVLIQIPGRASVSFVLDGTTYKLRVMSIAHRVDEQGWRVTFGFGSLDRLTSAYGAVDVFTLGSSALSGADILGP